MHQSSYPNKYLDISTPRWLFVFHIQNPQEELAHRSAFRNSLGHHWGSNHLGDPRYELSKLKWSYENGKIIKHPKLAISYNWL